MLTNFVEKFLTRWSALEKQLLPEYVWTSDPLTFWRERILFIICFLASTLGPFALIPSLWIAYQYKLWNVILLDLTAYVTAVVIIINRNWSLKVRTFSFCIILYALGACLLFILGPVGAGYIWLFGASVMISAIIGMEAAIWTLVLNAITLLSVAFFVAYGQLQWAMQYDDALEKWLVMSANFLLSNAFVTLTTAMMLNGLSKALSTEQDVSHRLQESEERFRAISEFSHHGICIIDEIGKIIWVNNRMLDITGYARERMKNSSSFADFIASESSDFVTGNYLKFRNGEVYEHHYHCNIIHADGEKRLIEIHMTDYSDKHNRKYLIINMLDVTDRKRAEDAILSSEKKFRQLFNSINDALFVHHGNANVLSEHFIEVNDVACQRLGYSREELLCMSPVDIHAPDRLPDLRRRMAEVQFNKPTIWESSHNTKDGRCIPVEITYQYFELNGELVLLSTARDITDRKFMEERLLQVQKMEAVGTLAGGIAHDFNNILNVIIGFGTMVIDTLEAGSPSKEQMNEVLSAAERAADLTKRLLLFSRKQVVEVKPVNINELILGLQKILVRIIRENIDFTLDLADRPLMVLADAGQIEQVLINLAVNARDAMPEGGRLTIGTRIQELDDKYVAAYGYGKPGKYALFTVTDTGKGMDEETQKNIFEPFFTTKGIGEGTGLGLSISFGIIKQHSGYIQVYSEPGQGTVFKIYLPITEEEALLDKMAEATVPIKTGNETVLVAEDDAALRQLARIVLESFGYSVILAEDGEDAITKFMENRERISLVFLDMIMPKRSGKEASVAIRKISPQIKILFASGYSMDIINNKESTEVSVDFIHKPFQRKELLMKVREILDR
ncbi:MAG: PAS domain S-box protein [Desulfatirhabdiaceae bacterium]